MIERIIMGAASAALITALYLTAPEQSEPERQAEQYCDMVEAWHDTNGEHGWPDYNENFDEVCDDE